MEESYGFHWQNFFQWNCMRSRLNERDGMKESVHERYAPVQTGFGGMAIVWRRADKGPRIIGVFLDQKGKSSESRALGAYPGIRRGSEPDIEETADGMKRFLEGGAVVFDLGRVALESCGEFQRKVLLAEYAIPRGWVSTYGRIAAKVGSAGGGRAVGRALAENPFPILIPCHRAVRSDGGIGGYQGGSAMKRALLAMEGVEFKNADRVAMGKVYY
jgi:methylated-DNA-[protein]-cysteine S-methyltransferase